MLKRLVTLVAAIGGFFLPMMLAADAARAEKRVALIVGNSAYVHATPLTNPINDATDMAAALTAVGFEVILGVDLGKVAFDASIRDFART